MNNIDKKALKADLALGYNTWMQQIYMKWGSKIDKDELRFTVAKTLSIHAMDKIYETHKRSQKKVKKTNQLISLLTTEINERRQNDQNQNQKTNQEV